jgi:hypothetical protein
MPPPNGMSGLGGLGSMEMDDLEMEEDVISHMTVHMVGEEHDIPLWPAGAVRKRLLKAGVGYDNPIPPYEIRGASPRLCAHARGADCWTPLRAPSANPDDPRLSAPRELRSPHRSPPRRDGPCDGQCATRRGFKARPSPSTRYTPRSRSRSTSTLTAPAAPSPRVCAPRSAPS